HLGGVCEHVHFFADEARRRGHHVDIITSHMRGVGPRPNVIQVGRSQPIFANGSMARITLGYRLWRQMRHVLRRGRYDIVHVHSPLVPTLPIVAIDVAECPVVGTFHTYFEHSHVYEYFPRYFQSHLDRLDAAIAVSPAAAEAHARYFNADWTIVPNGIDTDHFNPHAPPPPGFPQDVPVILFLGRLDPRNGLPTLVEAFRRVRLQGRRARLVVVGDGPLRAHYERMVGADPDITFVGSVLEARPSYYAHSAIYACPTTKASFGITLLEAMACGTPIVCSDIFGFREVVSHEREALLFPCGDHERLADALIRLLDDPALRARLGRTGRARSHTYNWTHVTDAVLDVYARVRGLAAVTR
ncbi:MAG TPA: glycosyltransferase family 4 protein, partial [Gemmatimonadaceae bacterium]|nr:glycosyltransferase family 4 protein [Gemmatimonadaceae bacterium]